MQHSERRPQRVSGRYCKTARLLRAGCARSHEAGPRRRQRLHRPLARPARATQWQLADAGCRGNARQDHLAVQRHARPAEGRAGRPRWPQREPARAAADQEPDAADARRRAEALRPRLVRVVDPWQVRQSAELVPHGHIYLFSRQGRRRFELWWRHQYDKYRSRSQWA